MMDAIINSAMSNMIESGISKRWRLEQSVVACFQMATRRLPHLLMLLRQLLMRHMFVALRRLMIHRAAVVARPKARRKPNLRRHLHRLVHPHKAEIYLITATSG